MRRVSGKYQIIARTAKQALLVTFGLWTTGILAIILVLRLLDPISERLLLPGTPAPMFALQDQDGRTHALKDYAGRNVALVFLPNAGKETLGQLHSLEGQIRQFDTLGVKLFGILPTDPAAAKRLHQAAPDFPLLTDASGNVAKAYGVHRQGAQGQRISYVIGPDGKILLPCVSVQADRHGPQLVELAECCLDSTPTPDSQLIGKPMADFTLHRVVDGSPVSLYGDHRQKATVLFITSAECPCSAKYDGRFVDYARRYTPLGVRFLAMNSSYGETLQEIAEHARLAGYPFPILKDDGNVIADRIGAQVTPEVFVLDNRGVICYHGRIDDSRNALLVQKHDLQNALDLLLAGSKPQHEKAAMFGCAIARKPSVGGQTPPVSKGNPY